MLTHTHTHTLSLSLSLSLSFSPPSAEAVLIDEVEEDDMDDSESSGYGSMHFFGIILVLVIFAIVAYLCVYNKKRVSCSHTTSCLLLKDKHVHILLWLGFSVHFCVSFFLCLLLRTCNSVLDNRSCFIIIAHVHSAYTCS